MGENENNQNTQQETSTGQQPENLRTINAELETLKKELEQRAQQLAELEKFKGTNEELTQRLETLKKENATIKQQHQEYITQTLKNEALQATVGDTAHDLEVIRKLIDNQKITVMDGKVYGMDEQIHILRESKPYLFVDSQKKDSGGVTVKGTPPPVASPSLQLLGKEQEPVSVGKALAAQKRQALEAAQKAEQHYWQK